MQPGTTVSRVLQFENVSYPFVFGFDCTAELFAQLRALEPDRFLVVTDEEVQRLHGPAIVAGLSAISDTKVFSCTPGEEGKRAEILLSFANEAISWGATRSTVVVTLGGGVPGNIGGLLASLLFRGIRLVHIPTTLIAALDSVVSLKQAVNLGHGKNLLGTFHVPTLIFFDGAFIQTLPKRHVRSGLCEVIKNALAICPDSIDYLKGVLDASCILSAETLAKLLELSLDAKSQVMARDRFEKRQAIVLEYGHSIGHAIEMAGCTSSCTKRISHGEAIGLGMIAAARMAYTLGYLSEPDMMTHVELLRLIDAKTSISPEVDLQSVFNSCLKDNKRGYIRVAPGCIPMILLSRLGMPILANNQLPLCSVPMDLIRETVEAMTLSNSSAQLAV